jgi:hypothetical protein
MTEARISRRRMLQIVAGAAGFAAGIAPAAAAPARIGRLIGAAANLPSIAQRIGFISQALLGTPYRGYTLIGSPRRPEQFVVRDDAFDCVTFCETVLAAARSRKPDEFESNLRQIRYRGAEVDWRARNHYFADWCLQNIANGTCRPLVIPGSVTAEKTVAYMPALGARRVLMSATPRERLLANSELLATGDIVGFLSERPRLDYFHAGFVVVSGDGKLSLRHAAKSKGRVLDEPLERFLTVNRVRAVTLLAAQELAPDGAPA